MITPGRLLRTLVTTVALTFALDASAQATPILFDAGNGLSASADFDVSGSTLTVLLSNTSTPPLGNQNDGSAMVLSSLSFDLPTGVTIIGGSARLAPGSSVVKSTKTSAWVVQDGTFNLNEQYGYSNTGVGNDGGASLPNATNALTSHNNGGNSVIAFGGSRGLPGGGLNWGLVPNDSQDIGNNAFFVQNSILLTLALSQPLTDLSFLADGSYVEFGSDHLYVPGTPETPPTPVPEPTSLVLFGTGAILLAARARRRSKR
jgi:hypothetical protein